jgi:hypothetical protein
VDTRYQEEFYKWGKCLSNYNLMIRDVLVYDPLSHSAYVYRSRICLSESTVVMYSYLTNWNGQNRL